MHQVRKAHKTDVHAIFALSNAAIRSESAGYYSDDIIVRWTDGETPDAHFCKAVEDSFYVAKLDGKVVASGAMTAATGKLEAIFVSPHYLRKGLGSAMLQFIEQQAIDLGLSELQLESTLNAVNFYQNAGFVNLGSSQYHSPRGLTMACVLMQKTINNNPTK